MQKICILSLENERVQFSWTPNDRLRVSRTQKPDLNRRSLVASHMERQQTRRNCEGRPGRIQDIEVEEWDPKIKARKSKVINDRLFCDRIVRNDTDSRGKWNLGNACYPLQCPQQREQIRWGTKVDRREFSGECPIEGFDDRRGLSGEWATHEADKGHQFGRFHSILSNSRRFPWVK